jgi:hypothetical protein
MVHISGGNSFPVVNCTNILGIKAEQPLRISFSVFSMITALGKNLPKYGTQQNSCSLNYAVKFQQECW